MLDGHAISGALEEPLASTNVARMGAGRVLRPRPLDEIALIGGGNTAFWWMRRCLDQARLNEIETWAVGSVGFAIRCHKIFSLHTKAVMGGKDTYPTEKGEQIPEGALAKLIEEYKKTGAEVVTTDGHDGTWEYPLAEVVEEFQSWNFICGAAMTIPLALLHGVKRLHVYGFDFDSGAERGADCVNYWLGRARERGVDIEMAGNSDLLGVATYRRFGMYGYGHNQPIIERVDGKFRVTGFK